MQTFFLTSVENQLNIFRKKIKKEEKSHQNERRYYFKIQVTRQRKIKKLHHLIYVWKVSLFYEKEKSIVDKVDF